MVFIFPEMLNAVCFSHTLDNVGSHLDIPILLKFGEPVVSALQSQAQSKVDVADPDWS